MGGGLFASHRNPVERGSPRIEQDGWARSLVGSSEDAGCPLDCSGAVARARSLPARRPGYPARRGLGLDAA